MGKKSQIVSLTGHLLVNCREVGQILTPVQKRVGQIPTPAQERVGQIPTPNPGEGRSDS